MTPILSIIIPQKRTPMNNLSMVMNFDMLLHNTVNSFELIIDTESPKDPYKIWNECSMHARGDILVFSNSDILFAPRWDEMFVNYMRDNAILVGYLVEPGNISVARGNVWKSFGKDPIEFNWQKFENWVSTHRDDVLECKEGRGWYMPCAFRRDWFLRTGGFDTTLGFPNPNDSMFFDKCRDTLGTKFYRVRSFAYHFQALSSRDD